MVSIMAFPAHGIHYVDLFYGAMRSCGARVVPGYVSGRYLLTQMKNIDFLHIHWPQFIYARPTRGQTLYGFAIFISLLALSRIRGTRVIWTVHNLRPHEPCALPVLDRVGRWLMVRLSARFLVHGPAAAREVLRTFPQTEGRITLIDFGNYISYYPDDLDRDEARNRLGLSHDAAIILFFGAGKPYKNIEGLVGAFRRLPEHVHMLIAGPFSDPIYETTIRALIEDASPRIRLHARYIADEDIQLYLRACDVVAASYHEILTSGTAMLALSFGRPIVAPKMGFLGDVVKDGCGVLYDPSDPDGLFEALSKALTTNFDESRIIMEAMTHDWKESAKSVADALNFCLEPIENCRRSRCL